MLKTKLQINNLLTSIKIYIYLQSLYKYNITDEEIGLLLQQNISSTILDQITLWEN